MMNMHMPLATYLHKTIFVNKLVHFTLVLDHALLHS